MEGWHPHKSLENPRVTEHMSLQLVPVLTLTPEDEAPPATLPGHVLKAQETSVHPQTLTPLPHTVHVARAHLGHKRDCKKPQSHWESSSNGPLQVSAHQWSPTSTFSIRNYALSATEGAGSPRLALDPNSTALGPSKTQGSNLATQPYPVTGVEQGRKGQPW